MEPGLDALRPGLGNYSGQDINYIERLLLFAINCQISLHFLALSTIGLLRDFLHYIVRLWHFAASRHHISSQKCDFMRIRYSKDLDVMDVTYRLYIAQQTTFVRQH